MLGMVVEWSGEVIWDCKQGGQPRKIKIEL